MNRTKDPLAPADMSDSDPVYTVFDFLQGAEEHGGHLMDFIAGQGDCYFIIKYSVKTFYLNYCSIK